MDITMDDYTPELAEIARVSEGGCSTFDVKKLTTEQRQAIEAIVAMNSTVSGGDIEYGGYIVRVIHNSLGRFVTVIESTNESEGDPNSIY